jgi:hypothetical protein
MKLFWVTKIFHHNDRQCLFKAYETWKYVHYLLKDITRSLLIVYYTYM